MNCDTGHLVAGGALDKLMQEGMVDSLSSTPNPFVEEVRKAYTPVPDKLNHAAECALDGKEETHISMTSGGKLSKWAAKERKNRRKQQRASRRQNR